MKKIIAGLLSLLTIISILSLSAYATYGEDNLQLKQSFVQIDSYVLGDVDNDGAKNAKDLWTYRAYLSGNDVEIASKDGADIDANGVINAKDVLYTKALIVGLLSPDSLMSKTNVYKFQIAGNDISTYTIVLPKDTEYYSSVYCSYELLSEYTNKATGFFLPLAYGEAEGNCIYYHVVDYDSEMGKELGVEGFIYEVKDGDLHIYGTQYRGNIYATYEILEDYLGFYFADDYYTTQFTKRLVNIEEGTYKKFVPKFSYRSAVGHVWGSTCSYHAYARKINATTVGDRTESRYWGTFSGPVFINAHSFYYYQAMGAGIMPEEGTLKSDGTPMSLADRYYQKMLDGKANGVERGLVVNSSRLLGDGPNATQPCATNEAEFNNVFNGLVDTIRMIQARGYDFFYNEADGLHLFSFSINDSSASDCGYCTCRKCKTIAVKNNEGYSGLYVSFANKAAQKIQEYYPGLSLYIILYDHSVPATIKPDEHLVIMYCGSGCQQHPIGSGECIEGSGSYQYGPADRDLSGKYMSNTRDASAIPQWIANCHENGTKFYFWYYPETYASYLFDVPDFKNIYYDIKWLSEVGADGIYFEGNTDGHEILTEYVKFQCGMQMMWNPDMTLDEYLEEAQKFCKSYYGDAWEEAYQYLLILDEAADAAGNCFYGAFDRIWDMYSKSYIAERYEEMHTIMESAIAKNSNSRVYALWANCEMLGLSAVYDSMYTNGTAMSRKVYETRYTKLHDYLIDANIMIYNDNYYSVPKNIDFSVDPATQFYVITQRRVRG